MKIYNKSRRCVVNTFYKSIYIALFLCCSFIDKSSKSINYTLETNDLKRGFC